jgi:Arc/MetJ family transcription regulator
MNLQVRGCCDIAVQDPVRARLTAQLCRLVCKEAHMATNLAIDPELLERALEVSGERTKKAAVTRALQEFIARREQAHILGLFGSVEIDPQYDYKAERSRG